MSDPLTSRALQTALDLDERTLTRLETYVALLSEWQTRVNLVGPSTLADPWRRHVLDSAQLVRHLPSNARTILDLGSGAGFPGLVLAILGVAKVTLVEATGKKCRFLEAVAEATGTEVEILNARAEALPQRRADVITARALAGLPVLLDYAARFSRRSTVCLFLKGASVERELTEAASEWKMTAIRHPSLTHPDGVLLELRNVQARAGA